ETSRKGSWRLSTPATGAQSLFFRFGGHQFPVGIARACIAREGPDILDLCHGFRVAVDNAAGAVARSRDQLAHDPQRYVGLAALHLRADNGGLVDPDERGLDLLRPSLPFIDGGDKTFVDVARQEVLERAPIAVRSEERRVGKEWR